MAETPLSTDQYFVVLRGPNYPRVMMADEDQIALWPTAEAAKDAIKGHAAVRAFGASIFQLDAFEDEV